MTRAIGLAALALLPLMSYSRSPVIARNGLVATSQPLASAAGLRVLQEGGNAIDAAVAAAAVLSVAEPTMTGVGGDLFAIVYDARTGRLHGLNASGRAPRAATVDAFRARKLEDIPSGGPLSVSVPGAVDGWAELMERFGSISLARALEPAMAYARDGFAVTPVIAEQWESAAATLAKDPAAAATFLIDGRAPRAGEIFANPKLAVTLQTIAREGRDAFYRGAIAKTIAADMARRGGFLSADDLAAHRSNWVEPLSTSYRGHQVYELPPNTQGFAALEMLNILEGFDMASMDRGSAQYLHLLVEAKKIAYADRDAYLADPGAVPDALLRRLISKEYAAARRKEIDLSKASTFSPAGTADFAAEARGDTVYLTAADRHGNVISLIQSLFSSFGSGIVGGDTGIALHNRGSLFSLDPSHPNAIGPDKRPFHTLVPAMVMKDGKPWLSFGVMGGDHQAQGHVQVLLNLIDFKMDVQAAGDAPRFNHGGSLSLEDGFTDATREKLKAMGHVLAENNGPHGGYQAILIDPRTKSLSGGSDRRKDGGAVGY
ncbi:MAG TPA: gamma-glutamyltransferase [Vicinamibacterales bacterium]|jgi:gamma-glutamyltranspeptidase/glutathione hydrolase|nr:gamma-glutamyltransferase [Vicinamibacterales bacterium]